MANPTITEIQSRVGAEDPRYSRIGSITMTACPSPTFGNDADLDLPWSAFPPDSPQGRITADYFQEASLLKNIRYGDEQTSGHGGTLQDALNNTKRNEQSFMDWAAYAIPFRYCDGRIYEIRTRVFGPPIVRQYFPAQFCRWAAEELTFRSARIRQVEMQRAWLLSLCVLFALLLFVSW